MKIWTSSASGLQIRVTVFRHISGKELQPKQLYVFRHVDEKSSLYLSNKGTARREGNL